MLVSGRRSGCVVVVGAVLLPSVVVPVVAEVPVGSTMDLEPGWGVIETRVGCSWS